MPLQSRCAKAKAVRVLQAHSVHCVDAMKSNKVISMSVNHYGCILTKQGQVFCGHAKLLLNQLTQLSTTIRKLRRCFGCITQLEQTEGGRAHQVVLGEVVAKEVARCLTELGKKGTHKLSEQQWPLYCSSFAIAQQLQQASPLLEAVIILPKQEGNICNLQLTQDTILITSVFYSYHLFQLKARVHVHPGGLNRRRPTKLARPWNCRKEKRAAPTV
mmetsp:Transcript_25212/g.58011  ORF Transcript_25212/g.58011 Transcript_25212/m.58011 type:complete len:216 (+) Transcript_25212:1-648(+)